MKKWEVRLRGKRRVWEFEGDREGEDISRVQTERSGCVNL
jgi:hypothetical protein